jgi:sugar O-acyltransferase (sialic acid O-acetyltransferase NeuD family)
LKNIIIFGTQQAGELADFYFTHDTEHEVAAFVVDGEYKKEDAFNGKPLLAFEEVATAFPPSDYAAFVAIGYSGLNAVRTEKVAALRDRGYELASYVSSKATTFPGFEPGPNAFILEDNTIQPFARIGENVTLWSGNHIGHHSVIGDNVFMASHIVVSGNCRIGARSFIGVNASFRDGVTIGERCIVGMGACVVADCGDETVFPAPKTEAAKVPSSKIRKI